MRNLIRLCACELSLGLCSLHQLPVDTVSHRTVQCIVSITRVSPLVFGDKFVCASVCLSVKLCLQPSGHTTLKQRFNVDSTSTYWRWINVESTLFQRCVPAVRESVDRKPVIKLCGIIYFTWIFMLRICPDGTAIAAYFCFVESHLSVSLDVTLTVLYKLYVSEHVTLSQRCIYVAATS